MQSIFHTLYARRPLLDYTCPPVCEVNFSGSSSPVIVLNPLFPNGAISGLERGGVGGRSLRWNVYPGAICYSIYQADIPGEAFGTYHIIAECLPGNTYELPPGIGPFVVTAITPDGETPPSSPIFGTSPAGKSSVTILADPDATSFDEDPATFTFYRTAPLTDALTVDYEVSGTALATVDYVPLPGSITFPSGQASVSVDVVALDSELDEDKNVVATLLEAETYDVEEPSSAVVTIEAVTVPTITPIGFSTLYHLSEDGHVSGYSTPSGFAIGGVWFEGAITPANFLPGDFQSVFPQACNSTASAGSQSGSTSNGYFQEPPDASVDIGLDTVCYALSEDGIGFCHTSAGASFYDPSTDSFTLIAAGASPAIGTSQNPGFCFAENHNAIYYTFGPRTLWLYSGGISTDVTPGGIQSETVTGVKVTSSGIVLSLGLVAGETHSYVYIAGTTHAVGLLAGGSYTDLIDVNESGLAVGYAETATEDVAVMWTLADGLQAIPPLPGTVWGEADGVNGDGWIVGLMGNASTFAFIYRDGVTSNLLDLIPDHTGWTAINRIRFINETGQIVGRGVYNGNTTFFIINDI